MNWHTRDMDWVLIRKHLQFWRKSPHIFESELTYLWNDALRPHQCLTKCISQNTYSMRCCCSSKKVSGGEHGDPYHTLEFFKRVPAYEFLFNCVKSTISQTKGFSWSFILIGQSWLYNLDAYMDQTCPPFIHFHPSMSILIYFQILLVLVMHRVSNAKT